MSLFSQSFSFIREMACILLSRILLLVMYLWPLYCSSSPTLSTLCCAHAGVPLCASSSHCVPRVLEKEESRANIWLGPNWLGGGRGRTSCATWSCNVSIITPSERVGSSHVCILFQIIAGSLHVYMLVQLGPGSLCLFDLWARIRTLMLAYSKYLIAFSVTSGEC